MLRFIAGAILALSLLGSRTFAQQIAPASFATLGGPLDQPQPGANPAPTESPPLTPLAPPTEFTGSYTTLPRPIADSVSLNAPGNPQPIPGVEGAIQPQHEGLFDNLSLFFGLDGSKEPADLGVNANFGYRFALNWGIPLLEQSGLGFQVGTAVNYSENAIRVLKYIDGTVDRWQNFTTFGLFQRAPNGWHWGVVYDFRFDDYYDRISAGQWRAQLSYEANPNNEFGFWATIRDHGDSASIGPISFSVEPISQYNVYWRHIWPNEIVTRFWVGIASEHSSFNLLLPAQSQVNHPFTFGADLFVPLTDHLAIFGEGHFITPNDTGTVTATLGIAWFPGSARGTARNRFAPLFPVANNTTFSLDVR